MGSWEKQYDDLNDIPEGMEEFYKHKAIQHSPPDAQAEIARLQAEVERLKAEKSCYAIDAQVDIDTAHNDVIEAAAHLIECDGEAMYTRQETARCIRALKRPT